MSDITSWVNGLETTLRRFEEGRAAVLSDRRWSEEEQRRQVQELLTGAQAEVKRGIAGLWGEASPGGPIVGGACWQLPEVAERRLRSARAKAEREGLDYTVLAYELQRAEALVRSARSLDEVKAAYLRADSPEQERALQDCGPAIMARFTREDGIGSFCGGLARDREQAARSPEVDRLERELQAVQGERARAWRVAHDTAQAVGLGGSVLGGGVDILRRVRASYRVDPLSGSESWEFADRGPSVVHRVAAGYGE